MQVVTFAFLIELFFGILNSEWLTAFERRDVSNDLKRRGGNINIAWGVSPPQKNRPQSVKPRSGDKT